MLRRTSLAITLLSAVWVILAARSGCAQDADRFERYFRELDKDSDGQLNSEEFSHVRDSTRERLAKLGVVPNRPIRMTEFVSGMGGAEEMRQKEREQERSSSNDPRSKAKGKTRITVSLPNQYAALDKNQDGQISMSEWDRTKLADFRTLDRNADGFLTPKELVNPQTPVPIPVALNTTTATAKTAVPAPGSSRSASSGKSGSSSKNATTSTATPAAPEAPKEDPLVRQGKYFFSTVDKDKDGQISQEEWAASRGVRPMFEKANVTPSFPFDESAFVAEFQKIKQADQ